LLVGVVFVRILFKALQVPLLTTIHIHKGIKELASLHFISVPCEQAGQ
jgi:hypothetical protein